ncbi:MAG: glutamine-hydrolyzing carbamoyl-phosphate synthase small subunit [Flavobacteriales bacterium]|nr:glutamine-hydrolyzing carbamoyl-phosphate synthase small subunit [Flavobacteriales bacterium]
MTEPTNTAILHLEDGTTYYGKSIGKIGTSTGEICFNTGMTGYQEVFTDPSYFGQMLLATNDHIGNYGVKETEVESDGIKISGLICKNFANYHSRVQANGSLNDYFISGNLVGISDVDTRQIVRHIRDKGAMNCIISSEILDLNTLDQMLKKVPSMEGLELSSKVTTNAPYFYGDPDAKHKIAVLDLGVKKNILRCFDERDCYMQVFPGDTSYETMMSWNPDGFFISNGPGDPGAMDYAVTTVQKILDADKNLFGICLGNQILARAVGMDTFKMHNGHRGLNHPVKNLQTGLSEITSQNHGFAVNPDSPGKNNVEITHLNLNDNTIEGIRVKGKRAFAVQYHPESSPGPHDSRYLFDDFIKML